MLLEEITTSRESASPERKVARKRQPFLVRTAFRLNDAMSAYNAAVGKNYGNIRFLEVFCFTQSIFCITLR